MGKWNRDLTGNGGEWDPAYPPDQGGPVKQALLGFGLAGYFVYLTASIWIHQYAVVRGRGGSIALHGPSARSLAFVSLGAALFCHARWFWGLRPGFYWTFERLTILSALLMIGGIAGAFWLEFG